MRLLIKKCSNELCIFTESKCNKSDWTIDTVCGTDDVPRFFGRIFEILKLEEE